MVAGIKDNETNGCWKNSGPCVIPKCNKPELGTGLPIWGHLINDAIEATSPFVFKAEKGSFCRRPPQCLLTQAVEKQFWKGKS